MGRFLLLVKIGFLTVCLPYKVVTSLKETGQYENTIIVVTTDNGGAVKVGGNNLPLRGTKGQCKIRFPDSQVPSACGMHYECPTLWLYIKVTNSTCSLLLREKICFIKTLTRPPRM